MNLPADTRQFSLKTIMLVMTSIAVAFAFSPYLPIRGYLVPSAVCVFWVGMGMLIMSDMTDHGPIDARRPVSQVLNLLGILTVIMSIAACSVCLLLNGMYKWLT